MKAMQSRRFGEKRMLAKERKNRSGRSENPSQERGGDISKQLFWTALVGGCLWLLSAALAYCNADPNAWVTGCSLATVFLTAFFGGWIGGKKNPGSPLLAGLRNGGLLAVLLLLGSLFIKDAPRRYSKAVSAVLYAGVLFAAVLGAYFASKPSKATARGKHR